MTEPWGTGGWPQLGTVASLPVSFCEPSMRLPRRSFLGCYAEMRALQTCLDSLFVQPHLRPHHPSLATRPFCPTNRDRGKENSRRD